MDFLYDLGFLLDFFFFFWIRKRRLLINDENDISIKYVCCGDYVLKWDNLLLEFYGIFYDVKVIEFFELFNLVFRDLYFVVVKGFKEYVVLWIKLFKIKEILVELIKRCL